ncbi:hypothetical protein [Burkholderia sp. Ac-20365]|nr:hypothetical protein [Burkholderia sp. Ac-20365]MBN3767639.1 hypothetical protein [Burkholderia sp. Ac-20365]
MNPPPQPGVVESCERQVFAAIVVRLAGYQQRIFDATAQRLVINELA